MTVEPGVPQPPAWAVVNVQAHILGLLLGVLVGFALLGSRDRRPALERVFAATLLFGLAQQLWGIALPGNGDEWVQYRGVGVVFVVVLALIVAGAVTASERPLPRPLSVLPWTPSRRTLASLWLGVLAMAGGVVIISGVVTGESVRDVLVPVLVATAVLAVPALPAVLPERIHSAPVTRRQACVLALVAVTVLVALPSIPSNVPVLDDDPTPGDGVITVEDYEVTYEENITDARISGVRALPLDDWGTSSGVIVVSEQREVWTTPVSEAVLEQRGNATVRVGGFGWQESVEVNRTGWNVLGNESAYVVDLEYGGERTRSFTSPPVKAPSQVSNETVRVEPSEDGFLLNVTRDGQGGETTAIPEVNETSTVGQFQFETREEGDIVSVFVEHDGTRVLLAERE